jgi:vancomycin resistance protein VanJ
MTRLITTAVTLLFATWFVGQVFRDRIWLTALCFYLPSPLVAFLLAVIALLALWNRQRRMACIIGILALGPLLLLVAVENHWQSPSPPHDTGRHLRLLHWNVFGGAWGWDKVRQVLRDLKADACVLSEAPGEESLEDLAAELGPGYTVLRQENLAVLARGRLTLGEPLGTRDGRSFSVLWDVEGTRFSLLVVDLPSSLTIARAPLLEDVRDAIVKRQPDLVVGDFNAPRRSRALSDLPTGHAHAYDLAGSGWSSTWPVPVPLWAIDQCIVGPRLTAHRYELRSTTASDHRLQVLDFSVSSTKP